MRHEAWAPLRAQRLASTRDGVPVSSSQSLKPFVGQTRGYNPPEDRVFLSEENFVLRAIREGLVAAGRRRTGARVFLTSSRAHYLHDDDEQVPLVTCDRPANHRATEVAAHASKF